MHKKEGFEGQKAVVIPRKIIKEQCTGHHFVKNLYITDIGFYPKARGHYRERPHGCDQHILIFVQSGKGYAWIGKEMFELSTGDFIFLPAKTQHRYESDEKNPWSIYWLHFSGATATVILEMMLLYHKSYKATVESGNRRENMFDELYMNLERGYSLENLCYVSMSLYHFLSSFIFHGHFNTVEVSNRKDAVNIAINFMRENLQKLLTLDEISGQVSLSSSHFSYLFRQRTGFAPMEYFNHLKMQKACQYLLFTDMRIKEISNQVGFDDPYYFSRLFSKLMGLSPLQYRTKRLT
ncbi:MAG TPA: AraC family transcriptional regulator [Flavitalea sp.]|nr:AraC family transcriptional regulator [Flavitalea sp.]